MGRNQIDSQGRAATDFFMKPENSVLPKAEASSKRSNNPAPTGTPTNTGAPPNSEWEFYHAGDSKKPEDHLKSVSSAPAPAPSRKNSPVLVKTTTPPRTAGASSKIPNASAIAGGAYILQVSALRRESDALELATRLQKKKFPAFVVSPQSDQYYRVQVGPYPDLKAVDVARKGLEDAGFKPIVKH